MFSSPKMQSLAVFAVFSCIAVTLANPQRESVCCKEVSSGKIKEPILGFLVQPARPPCVKAVIFYTANAAICSHWRETWVKEKVVEIRKLQAIEKNKKENSTAMTPPATDFSPTNQI